MSSDMIEQIVAQLNAMLDIPFISEEQEAVIIRKCLLKLIRLFKKLKK